jgi:prepilin-type N-terminal cleavage/methylation domain-containing protein/prepilin-type processing-associated H-X9-DG protein
MTVRMVVRRRRGGFTLIELLVVIAVVGLLAGMVLMAVGRARVEAHKTSCASNLKQIGVAFATYGNAHDDFYPCAADPVSASPFYWLWMGRGWRRFVAPFLGQELDAENPSVLFCRSDRVAPSQYESTSYAYSMCFYHTPDQIDGMTATSATYSGPQPSVGQRAGSVADPPHKVLAGEWLSNHRPVPGDQGWWTWEGARNFLFADGHAAFVEARGIRAANDGKPNPCLTRRGIRGDDIE